MEIWTCFLCHNFHTRTLKPLLQHLNTVHSGDPNVNIVCGIEGCVSSYKSCKGWYHHVIKFHRGIYDRVINDDSGSEGEEDVDRDNPADGHADDENDVEIDDGLPECMEERQRRHAGILMKLKEGNRLTQNTVDQFIDAASYFARNVVHECKKVFSNKLQEAGVNVDLLDDDVMRRLRVLETPFAGLETPWAQAAYYNEVFNCVEPVPFVFGRHIADGTHAVVEDRAYIVPFLRCLEAFLQVDQVFDEVRTSSHLDEGGKLADFCDGEVFRQHPVFSVHPTALQLFLYYDDFEITNPLTSKTTVVGAIYWTLGNIRPKYRSVLRVIQLYALFVKEDLRRHNDGLDQILSEFKLGITELENGYDFNVQGGIVRLHGALAVGLGDTPGIQKLTGFKEGVAFAQRFCRHCMAILPDQRTKYFEHEFVARTRQVYEQQCLDLLDDNLRDHYSKVYGINRRCIFADTTMDVTEQLPQDVMHILLEGLFPFNLKHLLRHCINAGYLTLNDINLKIREFLYPKYIPISERPNQITESNIFSDVGGFRQSAVQMWRLCTLMPFLVGDVIPREDRHWMNYIKLLSLSSLSMAYRHTRQSAQFLAFLVAEYLEEFNNLYAGLRNRPKQHYIVHFTRLLYNLGPLAHLWTMRYEAKHSYFKGFARRIGYKNVCLSLGRHHQMWMVSKIASAERGSFFKPEVVCNKARRVQVAELEYSQELIQRSQTLTAEGLVSICPWVQVNGTLYRDGFLVVTAVQDDLPVFGKITGIICVDVRHMIFFLLEVFETFGLEDHLNAYRVDPSDPQRKTLVLHEELLTNEPVQELMFEGDAYVILRRSVLAWMN